MDESIPRQAITDIVQPQGIKPELFCDWLGLEIGRYRLGQAANWPTRTQEIAALREFQKTMQAAEAMLSFAGLPPMAEALLDAKLYERGTSLLQLQQSLPDILMRLRLAAGEVETELSGTSQKRGAKSDPARQRLLAEVAQKFVESGAKPINARRLAVRVLALCGLQGLPEAKEPLRRAVKGAHRIT